MRAFAVVIVAVAALSVGATPTDGASAGLQKKARAVVGAVSPSWSPDGKQIAFAYVQYVAQKNCCGLPPSLQPSRYRIVRTLSRAGGSVHTVLPAADGFCCTRVQWAAGDRILLNPNIGLKAVGVRGGKPKRLFPSCPGGPSPGSACDTVGFILSPNREYAAAAVTADASDPHYAWGIGLVKLKAGAPAVLSTPLTVQEQDARIVDTALAFSPDGTQLVFSRTSWNGWDAGPPDLLAIRLDGGDPVPLAQSGIPGASLVPSDAQQVQWSPNGRWVAYVEFDSSRSNLRLEVVPTSAVGRPAVLATCSVDSVFRFSWAPTSKSIAYNCTPGDWTGGQFMTVNPDGTHLTNLLKDGALRFVWHWDEPQWSPDGSRLLFLGQGQGHRTAHVWTVRPDGRDLTRIG
jgi:Tol biopolymer transport system component